MDKGILSEVTESISPEKGLNPLRLNILLGDVTNNR